MGRIGWTVEELTEVEAKLQLVDDLVDLGPAGGLQDTVEKGRQFRSARQNVEALNYTSQTGKNGQT